MKRLLCHNNPHMSGEPTVHCTDKVLILEVLPHSSPLLPVVPRAQHSIVRCVVFPARKEVYVWRMFLDRDITFTYTKESVVFLSIDPGGWTPLDRAGDVWKEYVAGYYQ